MLKSYDETIKALAIYVRERLSAVEAIHTVAFNIDVSGRAHDGALEVKYELGSSYAEGGVVKGPKLDIVIDEYLRRFGWDKRNQPLCISFDGAGKTETLDEEIPF